MITKWFRIFAWLVVVAEAFSPQQHSSSPTRVVTTALSMGWFDTTGKKKATSSRSAAGSVAKKKETTNKKKSDDWIKNMFSPVHGGGSAKEKDLDAIYETQQRILADRRKHLDSKTLKSKYKSVGQDHLRDIDTIKYDPKALNQKEDDAMYIDQDHDKKTSFLPWNKKLKP